ncbi:MAG: DUF2460 domain-containing protein [Sphingomonadaceae bacterium]
MQHYLAQARDLVRQGYVKRFEPRLWSVDFPRPMMAAITNPEPATIRVDLAFLARADLAGLIWSSQDRWSHPLLAYETRKDYRGCTLVFDWVSGPGLRPLDAVGGPTLTIEGRTADGEPKTWYVRLWNYAEGSPTAARITLDFDSLDGGFLLPSEADPVFAGDIDRLFISLVCDGFDGSEGPLASPLETWVELRNVFASGEGGTIRINDAFLPEHQWKACSGFDDSYNQAPERLVDQWIALGYRDAVNHYVGMSHYPALQFSDGRYEVRTDVVLNQPTIRWHQAFAASLRNAGLQLILSLSYELFDAYAPPAWAQRDLFGNRALTGWDPPSTLLSPNHPGAMAWLQSVAQAFADIAAEAAGEVHFQVGEPWWWVGPSHAPCFYDPETSLKHQQAFGEPPPPISDIRGPKTPVEQAFLDWLGDCLAGSTAALVAAVRAHVGVPVTSYLLFFSPQVLESDSPELLRANMPLGWAKPAFDVFQLEDYDFVTSGNLLGQQRGWDAVVDRLGYPIPEIQYFSGFVLNAEDAAAQWPAIMRAGIEAEQRGCRDVFLWAWPQIARDGLAVFSLGKDAAMNGFHDVRFPLELGLSASGGPEFRTDIVTLTSGFERRNILWSNARLRYDAGLGVRSEADLRALVAFFRARFGPAFAFRLRDPLDYSTAAEGEQLTALDVELGVGDGARLRFPLVKTYGDAAGDYVRRITRPVPGTVRVAIDGTELLQGWSILEGGVLQFEDAPAAGARVTAGFLFDVPVRFESDRLEVSLSTFQAGEVPSVPLVEVREQAFGD